MDNSSYMHSIEQIGVELEAGIIDQKGYAQFTTYVNGNQKKIFDIIYEASPKDLQTQMKPEIFSNMVELVTDPGSIEEVKKEAIQLWEWLEEVVNKLWLILSRKVIYPVNYKAKDVLSREELYKKAFDAINGHTANICFNARTLGLHMHMSWINDQETIWIFYALNNYYANLRPQREKQKNILISKERYYPWKKLVEVRNDLGQKHGWFLPIRFENKEEIIAKFFEENNGDFQNGKYPNPIESHRIVTLKKPGKNLTTEDRHADCPLSAEKIPATIDTLIQNVQNAQQHFFIN